MVTRPSFKRKTLRKGGLALGAFALVLGSFAFASAQFTGSPGALFAAVASSINGKPLIAITRNVNSPSGTITPGRPQVLGTFDVRTKNVSNFATLKTITVRVTLSGTGAKTLNVENFNLNYNYCVPSGISYGYGYPGGLCGMIRLPIVAQKRIGNTYALTFNQPVQVYPVQSSGVFTLSGLPKYTVAT